MRIRVSRRTNINHQTIVVSSWMNSRASFLARCSLDPACLPLFELAMGVLMGVAFDVDAFVVAFGNRNSPELWALPNLTWGVASSEVAFGFFCQRKGVTLFRYVILKNIRFTRWCSVWLLVYSNTCILYQ